MPFILFVHENRQKYDESTFSFVGIKCRMYETKYGNIWMLFSPAIMLLIDSRIWINQTN